MAFGECFNKSVSQSISSFGGDEDDDDDDDNDGVEYDSNLCGERAVIELRLETP